MNCVSVKSGQRVRPKVWFRFKLELELVVVVGENLACGTLLSVYICDLGTPEVPGADCEVLRDQEWVGEQVQSLEFRQVFSSHSSPNGDPLILTAGNLLSASR